MDLRTQIYAMQSIYAPLYIEKGEPNVTQLQKSYADLFRLQSSVESNLTGVGASDSRITNLPNFYQFVPNYSYYQFMRIVKNLPDYREVQIHTVNEDLSEPKIEMVDLGKIVPIDNELSTNTLQFTSTTLTDVTPEIIDELFKNTKPEVQNNASTSGQQSGNNTINTENLMV
jgi:hypothetical protein